jgi:hypothetical protein
MLEPQAVKGRLLVARCLVNDTIEGTVQIFNSSEKKILRYVQVNLFET